MKFVEDIKEAWKWLSMWLISANATLVVAYEQVQTVKDYIPTNVFHYLVLSLLVMTALGRVIKQGANA